MIKRLLKFTKTLPQFKFSTNKISDIIEDLSRTLYQQQLVKDEKEEEILKNYIELTQESYLQHLLQENKLLNEKSRRIDPSIILMILPTLQKQEAVRQHLLMVFPYVSTFNSKQLLLFLQYLLAYKLTSKPKIPSPKPLIGSQGLLMILSELYPKDFLIEWLKQVPLYNGKNVYMIAMGAFSIISGLSQKIRGINKKLIDRCFQRIGQLFSQEDSEVRIGIMILGLQMNIKFIEELIVVPYCLQFSEIDGIKISLLIIQLDRYIKDKYSDVRSINPLQIEQKEDEFEGADIDEGVNKPSDKASKQWKSYTYNPAEPEHIKYKLELYLSKLVNVLVYQQWKNIIKLHTLVKLFHVLNGKKIEKTWLKLSDKLFNFTLKKQQITTLSNLTTDDLVGMVEVIQRLKINKPQLIKNLLVVLSDRLEQANKQELIRLSKCLVTYVRLCEDYLVHFRQIIERRKFIFSAEDIDRLNDSFRRVQVLFPKPLSY